MEISKKWRFLASAIRITYYVTKLFVALVNLNSFPCRHQACRPPNLPSEVAVASCRYRACLPPDLPNTQLSEYELFETELAEIELAETELAEAELSETKLAKPSLPNLNFSKPSLLKPSL
jgi:hypothetical protein